MSYGKMVVESLQELDFPKNDTVGMQDTALGAGDEKTVEKTFDNVTVKVEVLDVDKYSCVVSAIEVKADAEQSAENLLKSQADCIIDKVDYLTESFALIEFDELNGFAQIRSHRPAHKAKAFEYFEILLTKDATLSFQRYVKNYGEEHRKALPAILPFEQLERLIDDFLALWLKR